MPKLPELSAVVISIDGDMRSPAARHGSARLDDHQLAATWATADFRQQAAATWLGEHHETALLASEAWLSSAASRSRLMSELTARSAGHTPTTIVLGSAPLSTTTAELLVRAGINAVRIATTRPRGVWNWLRGSTGTDAGPQPLRWGLWKIESTAGVADLSLRAWRRRLDRAVEQGGLVHVTIDLDQSSKSDERHIDRVLQAIAERRDHGRLANLTIAGVMQRLVACHQARPAQSILARAA